MQDLSRYRKKEFVEINSRYISPLLVGAVVVVGLVFAMGVLVGSRNATPATDCVEPDILAKLNEQVGEPEPPGKVEAASYHTKLNMELQKIPVPASLKTVAAKEGPSGVTEAEELANVVLKQPELEELPVPEKIRDDEAGVFTLQVGSFQDQREASVMVDRLKRAGHKSFLVRVSMPEQGGTWYRVRVGPFTSKKQAWTYKAEFENKERLPAFVVKRRG